MIRKITLFLMLFFPVVAGAFTIGDLSYTVTNNSKLTVSVGSATRSISGDVVIPATVEYEGVEYIVTSIAKEGFDYCGSLTSIEIPNSVTTIGDYAFLACSSLTLIEIPNSVTAIGSSAFYYCSSLTSITIPNSVIAIGDDAFGGCSITSVEIPNSVTAIGSAFYGCSSLTSITIPNSVIAIGDDAFGGCSSLTSVEIPNSVTAIGDRAFYGCSSLTSITIPNSVTTIGDYAFLACSSLTSVEIPNSVTAIGDRAFYGCSSLTSITIPNSITTIGDYAFGGCSSLTSVEIPNSVTTIGNSAFYNCKGLNLLNIPESVATIEKSAFYGIDTILYAGKASGTPWGAKKVIRGYVKDGDFVYADSTKSCIVGYLGSDSVVVIPNSVTTIGDDAFYGCSSLTSVEIPNSVTTIGNSAFYNCKGLNLLNIPESVATIGTDAFNDIDMIFYAGKATGAPWGAYNVIRVVRDGYFLYADSTKSCIVDYLGSDSVVVIPNSVTAIGDEAFKGCTNLTAIEIPNSVTTIGASAFYNCKGLNLMDVPESVASIGKNAFYGIDTIFYAGKATGTPWGASKVIRGVRDGYFLYADSTKSCIVDYLGSDSVVVIPNSVTAIGDEAFKGCTNLTAIEIPNSVTAIGASAFYNCKGLNLMDVPESVSTIEKNAFYGIDTIFYAGNASGLPWGAYNVIRVVRDGYFLYADSTKSCIVGYLGSDSIVVIPNSVTAIGDEAFKGCTKLTAIEIPNSVTAIGKYAFYGCSRLTSVELPNSVTAIGSGVFEGCSSLTTIEIPNSVTGIGEQAFYNCKRLNPLNVPESVATIGEYAFYGIDTIFYAGKATGEPWGAYNVIRVVRDGYFLYADSTKLCIVDYLGADSVVVIPNSVTAIGVEAFKGSTNLTSVEIPNSVTAIGNSAFYGCSRLTSIDVPESVATIGKNAFYGIDTIFYAGKATGEPWGASKVIRGVRDGYFLYADSTKSCIVDYLGADSVVVIPNSVTAIGVEAFKGCSNLTSVEIPNSVTAIGRSVFSGCSGLTTIVIPNSVTAVGSSAFYGCSSLTSIEISNSVTGIGEQAFYNCKGLNLMDVPESVATIGKNAFYGIDTIFYAGKASGLPWGAKRVIRGTVKDEDFVYADSTKSCIVGYLGSDSVVVIPNSVVSIGAEAFNNCKGLKFLSIPDSVSFIGENAFLGVDTISYFGDAEGLPWGAKIIIHDHVYNYCYCACGMRDTVSHCIFDIYTADDLFEFARLVNEGNQWLEARLMNDIVVNEVDWSEYDVKDTLPSTLLSSVNIWKGIKKPYRAIFDGQNHSIKGLLYHSNGFFDQLSGAAIKNVGFENCRMVTYRDDDVCGLISRRADSSVFINCHTSGEILNYNVASGFVGYGSNLTFESCYNMASVEGVDVVAGFTSGISYDKNRCIIFDDCWNGGTISSENSSTMTLGGLFSSKGYGFILYINNCYNIGDIYTLAYWTDETGCGGLVGGRGAVDVFASNCYNIGKISATEEVHVAPLICNPYKLYKEQNFVHGEEVSTSGFFYHNCYYLENCLQTGVQTDISPDLDIQAMTSEQFANGEVCYRLNKGVTDGTQPFYQNLADIRPAPSDMQTITIDPYPVLDKSHRTVYTDGVRYYNKLETTSEKVLSSSDAESKIYSDGNTLYVKNAAARVVLYEMNGRVIYSKKTEENAVIEISNLKTGVYLLVVDGSPSKVLVR